MLANTLTVNVKLTNEHALRLLEELQHLGALTIESAVQQPALSDDSAEKKTFTAMSINTRGFKFDREEANER